MTVDAGWTWPRLHEAQRHVLLDMIVHGERSRADLARRAGMSRTSLTRLTRDLVALGLVAEGEITMLAGRGRPAEMLNVVPSSAHVIGVKLTGDALYAQAIDLQARSVAQREVQLESRNVNYVIDLIADVVASIRLDIPRVAAVGVCLAGDVRVDRDGRSSVVGSHFLRWDDEPLQSLVEAAVGLPVAISNDVQALTTGHHWFGRGAGLESLAVVGYGEGVGVGLIVNGDLVRGAHGRASKIDHLWVGDYDRVCDAGHRGCVSALAPLPKILHASASDSVVDVLDRAQDGDSRASDALDAAAEALGALVAHVVNLVDPHMVLITGEGLPVARAREELMLASARSRVDARAVLPPVTLETFRFADYARGAAIQALQYLIR